MARPLPGDHSESYQTYIDETIGHDTIHGLVNTFSLGLDDFIINIPESKGDYTYAEGKWTVKDLLQHMIDTERIMTYRALTFARKDAVVLPGFDENNYAASAAASLRSLTDLQKEYINLRKATDLFLLSLSEEQLQQKGISNGYPLKVNSIAFMIIGHNVHHMRILQERYL